MTAFRMVVFLIFSLFMALMLFVTTVAYARKSGNTGIDASKIQKIRIDHKR